MRFYSGSQVRNFTKTTLFEMLLRTSCCPGSGALRGSYRSSVEPEAEVGQAAANLQRAALYVIVDKQQIKGIKVVFYWYRCVYIYLC